VNNGIKNQKIPETIEQLVEAECQLAREYHFDGSLIYFPGMRKGAAVGDLIRKSIETLPEGDASNNFDTADPQNWPIDLPVYQKEDFYSSFMTRQILGNHMHIGGWAADGFSRAIQWFPTFDEAMMASVLDPFKFRALVDYFDHQSIAWAKAQIELGKLESIQISSPYAGSSLISLNAYRHLVLDSVKKLAEAIRSVNGISYLHTCGFIGDRIDLFRQTGVDGIECMDPPPLGDMLLEEAKKRIGSALFLKGNIDSVNILLRADDPTCDRVIIETIKTGMPHGGYILSTACSVAPDVPARRVKRLWQLVEQYGIYSKDPGSSYREAEDPI
jgi:hypothetical protein